MPPKPFYEVNPDAYIFKSRNHIENPEQQPKPEERVRQWMLYELLSTYGIHIRNIQVERPVKVGTRTYRADIVVHKSGAPYVVIECKRWRNKKIEKGIDQAISYADANTIKAEFAAFTNGDVWRVKRKIRNEWVDVPDINRYADSSNQLSLDELISDIHEFEPILYWFDHVVGKDDANAYFSALQIVFNGRTFPLDQIDRNLCIATDNLLRVLCSSGDHPNYMLEKLNAACRYYSIYFKERLAIDDDIYKLDKDSFFYLTGNLSIQFDKLVAEYRGIVNDEVLLIRLITVLIRYLCNVTHRKPSIETYIDIPVSLNDELHKLLDYLYCIRLGIEYPDRLVDNAAYPFRISCEDAWEKRKIFSKP